MIRLALIFPVLCFVLFGAHLLFHGWGVGNCASAFDSGRTFVRPSPLLRSHLRHVARLCGL